MTRTKEHIAAAGAWLLPTQGLGETVREVLRARPTSGRISVSVTLLLALTPLAFAQPPEAPSGFHWETVSELTDEFDGTELDATKWHDCHPVWNGRGSRFSSDNTFVKDGKLGLRSTVRTQNADGKFTIDAAAVVSKQKSARPGYYYETSIKASDLSMTSSFWFRMGKFSEIDVIENVGRPSNPAKAHFARQMKMNTHYYRVRPKVTSPADYDMGMNCRDHFITYGLWWKDPHELRFYCNGKLVNTLTRSENPFSERLHMIFDTEVFSWLGAPTAESLNDPDRNTMWVDWVRTYKLAKGDEPVAVAPAAGGSAARVAPPAEKPNERPNILFIMSDDHAAHALGAYGGRLASLNPTPNLDKLAAGGMLFENAFCNNSICTPSRASIMTGQFPQTHGVLDLDGRLPAEKHYLPMEMKKLGYSTAVIGKWHLFAEPEAFDFYNVLPVQGRYVDPLFREKGQGEWPDNLVKTRGHSTDVITDITIEYLKKLDRSQPFFLMHHYKAPHAPFQAATRYTDYLVDVDIPEPASLYEQPHFGSDATRGPKDSLITYLGSSVSPRNRLHHMARRSEDNQGLTERAITHLAYQRYLKSYLRCVKGVDDNLGRLFAFLKDEGLWDNTVILYTGDQGMMLGEHDYQDKRWMYEESMRMPFLVHYPGAIKPGSRSDLLINNTDFAPTMIALTGGAAPSQMQGRSFVNTLIGKPEHDWRTATYYRYWMHIIHHYVPAHFGIRTQDSKLIFYYGAHYLPPEEFENFYWADKYEGIDQHSPPAWEFYDLKQDPQELHNRYGDPAYAARIASLKEELKRQRRELDETDAKYPALQAIIEAHWED